MAADPLTEPPRQRGLPREPIERRIFASLLARLRYLGPGAPVSVRPGRLILAAVFAGIAAAALLMIRLFYPSTVGLGDQGDGNRLLCNLGVTNVRPWDYTDLTKYVYPQWTPYQWYGEACGADGSGEYYSSSQILIAAVAKYLTPLAGLGPGLDTRMIGVVCSVLFGLLLAWFIFLCPGKLAFRLVVAAGLTLLMADPVFADFFVSPYSEPAAFLGTFALLNALMVCFRRHRPGWLGMALVLCAAAFTIAAKTQTVSFLPVLALALLWRPGRSRRPRPAPHKGTRPRKALHWMSVRRVGVLAVVALTAFSVAFMTNQPKRFSELNLYNAVFVEMLPHSPSKAEDLRWFGLDPSMASASGTTVASANSAVYLPAYHDFLDKVTLPKIAVFYATHPDRLVSMAERGIGAMTKPRLDYIGSFTADSGHSPLEKEHRIPLFSGIFNFLAVAPVLIPFLHLLALVLAYAVQSRPRTGRAAVALGSAVIVLIPSAWLQFWAVMLTEGQSEIYKHMIIVDFMTALLIPLGAALAAILASGGSRHGPQSVPPSRRRTNRALGGKVTDHSGTDQQHRGRARPPQAISE
jgi:hypothetical protein